MSLYKSGFDRNQLVLFPDYIEDMIDENSEVRVIDAFVDYLNLDELGFKFTNPSIHGNKPYNPADMLKLYLFGYRFNIRSSRKLMYQSRNNIELIWLIKGIKPDFRSISDFRKDNIDCLKKVFFQFNLVCKNFNLISNTHSQDGTKLKAVNSKDKNYTLSKIDDRTKRIKEHIQEYLTDIELDDNEKPEKLAKIDELKSRLAYYESIEKELIDNNLSQKSITDPDSKLMKDNGKFSVSYNDQVLVDSSSHIVSNFDITSNPADLGSMNDICSETKDIYELDSLTNVTDKGYFDRDDMMNCLNNGIIPEVTPNDATNYFTLETEYIPNDITDDMINSTNPKDIKTCLSAGVIPSIYKDKISNIEIKDTYIYEDDISNDFNLTDDECRDKAINDYCFVRNINSNKVFCPMGEILRKKSSNSKSTKYCNKLACKNCKNPCCSSSFKEVKFSTNQIISTPKSSSSKRSKHKKRTKKIVKKVFITLKPNYDLLKNRMGTSEHPHAQMKFWDNARYVLLKGKEKVTGEVALYYCAYNIRRASKIIGVKELVMRLKKLKEEKALNNTDISINNSIFSYFYNFIKNSLPIFS